MGETQVKGPVGSPGGGGSSPETPPPVPGSPTQAAANCAAAAAEAAELVAAGDAGAMALTATLPHAGACCQYSALRHVDPVHASLAHQVISVGNRQLRDLFHYYVCVHSASINRCRRLRFMPSCFAGGQSM